MDKVKSFLQMGWLKKLFENKEILIIILAALVISMVTFFYLYNTNGKIQYHEAKMDSLHTENAQLHTTVDSLQKRSTIIDSQVTIIKIGVELQNKKLVETQKEIYNLKQRRNEVHTYVNTLDASGISSEFAKYLKGKTNSNN